MWVNGCQMKVFWRTGVRKFSTTLRRNARLDPSDSPTKSPLNGASADDIAQKSRNFLEEQNFRRRQAGKSVLVEVPSVHCAGVLQNQCREFGPVESMFHYRQGEKEFILVELADRESVTALIQTGRHAKRDDILPVRTRLLDGLALKGSKSVLADKLITQCVQGTESVDEELKKLTSMSAQIEALYRRGQLPELGARLRYFIASQIEDTFSGFFPCNRAYLFGSSVNGFGHENSDVDMILDFDVGHSDKKSSPPSSCDLRFATKFISGNGRHQTQRSLELLADHLSYLLPGYSNVQRILMARVPILKFNHDASGVQCDLSIANMSGLVMSDYLYTLGQTDERLRALVVTIRRWAKAQLLTNPHPGQWITNFTLTIMAVFFMQQQNLLPPLNQLKRDLPKKPVSIDSDDLKTLLLQFFQFYSTFDYKNHAISVIEGVAYPKPEFGFLYIENPVEAQLNICKNLTAEELYRLVVAMRHASYVLETSPTDSTSPGVLPLFSYMVVDTKKRSRAVATERSSRSATNVQEYFRNDEEEDPTSATRKFLPDEYEFQAGSADNRGGLKPRSNSVLPLLNTNDSARISTNSVRLVRKGHTERTQRNSGTSNKLKHPF